jgi:hypothetical protein
VCDLAHAGADHQAQPGGQAPASWSSPDLPSKAAGIGFAIELGHAMIVEETSGVVVHRSNPVSVAGEAWNSPH